MATSPSLATDAAARPSLAPILAPALLAAAVVALAIGGYVRFDDTSGFGDQDFVSGWARVAAALLAGALVIGLPQPLARRRLGIGVALVCAASTVLAVGLDGFRLVFKGGDGELNTMLVVLALISLFLLPTRWVEHEAGPDGARRPRLTLGARIALEATGLVVLGVAVFLVVAIVSSGTTCAGAEGGCVMALVVGSGAGLLAAGVGALACLVLEVRHSRRRAGSGGAALAASV